MAIKIGSNIASIQAQRRLGEATSTLTKIYERLSSGQRINKAQDDPAGLAISDSLKASVRVYSQAIRNTNDGLSLLTVAEEANKQLSGIVTRIAELAEQASNGSYSNNQRIALDNEAQALKNEFTRIIESTEFNGIRLLNGSTSSVDIQVGLSGNTDGRISITTGASNNGYSWDGTFSQTGTFANSARVSEAKLVDLNGDGILDSITQSDSGGNTEIRFGNGDGTFGTSTNYGNAGVGIATADFDRDGDIDFVSRQTGVARLFTNNGSGVFSSSSVSAISGGTPYAEDLNGDGNEDIIVVNGPSDEFYVMFGNGNGTFSALTTRSTGAVDISSNATFADMNNDGKIDYLVASATSSANMYWGIGNGDGTFTLTSLGASPLNSTHLSAGDINNDGTLDLVISDYSSPDTVYVKYGNGNGTFQASRTLLTENVSDGIKVLDLNGDGYNDLLTSNQITGNISVYTGSSSGTFTQQYDFTATAPQRSIATGDVNGDGVTDFIVPGWTNNNFLVFEAGATESSLMNSFSLRTASEAKSALDEMQRTISNLGLNVGRIGADRARLETALANIAASKTENTSAESRIKDVDFAFESSQLIKQQILQQVSVSILAQANQSPALALKLLK